MHVICTLTWAITKHPKMEWETIINMMCGALVPGALCQSRKTCTKSMSFAAIMSTTGHLILLSKKSWKLHATTTQDAMPQILSDVIPGWTMIHGSTLGKKRLRSATSGPQCGRSSLMRQNFVELGYVIERNAVVPTWVGRSDAGKRCWDGGGSRWRSDSNSDSRVSGYIWYMWEQTTIYVFHYNYSM